MGHTRGATVTAVTAITAAAAPPPPPAPPLLPLPSGEVPAYSPQNIQKEIDSAIAEGRNASIYTPPGSHLRFSNHVTCNGKIHLSVRSSGEGATLNGEKRSSMFAIQGGCSLTLEALHFVDGSGIIGGAVQADGAGDILMNDVSFAGCEASEVLLPSLPRTSTRHRANVASPEPTRNAAQPCGARASA